MNTFDVTFWTIETRKERRTPYRVGWTVAGRLFRQSCLAMALAESFQAQLISAARRGEECMTRLEDVWISRMDGALHLEDAPPDQDPSEDGEEDLPR